MATCRRARGVAPRARGSWLAGVTLRHGGCSAQVAAASISSNDFRSGVFIEVDGAPYRVLGTRDSAAARARTRAVGSGASLTLARRAPAREARQGRRLCAHEAEEPSHRRVVVDARARATRRSRCAAWRPTYLKSARMRCTGNTVEKTFRAGEKVRSPRRYSRGAALTVFPG